LGGDTDNLFEVLLQILIIFIDIFPLCLDVETQELAGPLEVKPLQLIALFN
jgi:hypothetical protein